MIIPTIIEKNIGYDIFSRLLKDRIIFVGGREGEVSTETANMIIAQLLYLDAEDSSREINLYINSPGGLVTAGLAIYDTMQYIKAPITTICMGQAMSFGAVLFKDNDTPAFNLGRRNIRTSYRYRNRIKRTALQQRTSFGYFGAPYRAG